MDSKNFDRIKSDMLREESLTNLEREIIKILKNLKITPSHRINLYKQLLSRHLNSVKLRPEENFILDTQPIKKTNFKRHALHSTMLDDSFSSKQSSTKNHLNESDVMMDDLDISRIDNPRASTPEKMEIIHENSYDSSKNGTKFDGNIYFEDENQFDADKEMRDFIGEIERQSVGGKVDLSKLTFRHIDDPKKDFVVVTNTETGDEIVVEKSEAVIEMQRKSVKRSHSPVDAIEDLSVFSEPHPRFSTPRPTSRLSHTLKPAYKRSKIRDLVEIRSPIVTRTRSRWAPFEDLRQSSLPFQ